MTETSADAPHDALELVEILASQCEDHSIAAADLIEWSERDDIGKALRLTLAFLDDQRTRLAFAENALSEISAVKVES